MTERFAHMYAAESDIWRQWLKVHRKEYQNFQYDLHVGRLWPELQTIDPKWRKGAEAVYLKRIDVVGYQPDVITIFEVKVHAGLGALGQILGYVGLYEEQFAPKEELRGTIVASLVDPNVERLLEEHGIDLHIIEEY